MMIKISVEADDFENVGWWRKVGVRVEVLMMVLFHEMRSGSRLSQSLKAATHLFASLVSLIKTTTKISRIYPARLHIGKKLYRF